MVDIRIVDHIECSVCGGLGEGVEVVRKTYPEPGVVETLIIKICQSCIEKIFSKFKKGA